VLCLDTRSGAVTKRWRVDAPNRATTLFETGSLRLHDSVHMAADLFLMTVADRNSLILADVERGRIVAEWDFSWQKVLSSS
jgi:hypothetical protein